MDTISFAGITSLALADSVNPCAIAVLTMVLVSIIIHNPKKRKNVLFAGLAFIAAVYIGYLVYGAIIINLFNAFAIFLRNNSMYIFNGLAILAMILGALNIKDYFQYSPGGLATEMPMFMRPHAKMIVSKMTSPGGSFIIGFLVTLFLLPCTIGPYIIASGLLANLGVIKALPWLLYYNLLFVLPMGVIVGLVYWGYSRVEDVSGWKERHIKKLHLIAGILLFLVGFSLLMGWL